MADPIVTPQELLGKLLAGQEVDVLREAALAMLRELMEIEVQAMTGAALGKRSPERLCMRRRISGAASRYPGGHSCRSHPQAARRQLLPQLP